MNDSSDPLLGGITRLTAVMLKSAMCVRACVHVCVDVCVWMCEYICVCVYECCMDGYVCV